MILDQIVEATRQRVAEEKKQSPLDEVMGQVARSAPPKDFRAALESPGISLIAEVKRASPSKGPLNLDLDVASLVQSYSRAGAVAISVLTEPDFFKGSFADLALVRQTVDLPILCKDFIVDIYQVYQARSYGADCVLLIAAALSIVNLDELLVTAQNLGMAALVEVHDEHEMQRAFAVEAEVIGINNRNLADFTTDLGTTSRLVQKAPVGTTVVSESGIESRADVLSLQDAGVKAILVGETLVTSGDPEAKIRELLGT